MKIVILDRDGVINEDSAAFVKSCAEWHAIPGSIDAIALLSQAGFEVFVVTNQSGLARGLFGIDDLEAMHAKMRALVEQAGGRITDVYHCPHAPEACCDCRKPGTGMLDALERQYSCSVAGSWMIGDSQRDIELAWRKQCKPLLVLTGNGGTTAASLAASGVDVPCFADLAAAARMLADAG